MHDPPAPPVLRVFAQTASARFPADALILNAATHFDATATVTPVAGGDAHRVDVTFAVSDTRASFEVRARARTEEDLRDATVAERRGNAAGMAALAARSSQVWVVDEATAPGWAWWECCALLALTALGPILPSDGSTLLGVRGARARAEQLRRAHG